MTQNLELGKLAQLLAVNTSSVAVGNTTVNTALSVYGSNISPVQSFRNKIINGNFDIWQRGTSTSTSAGFAADRWNTINVGSTFTSSQQTFTLGQTSVPSEPTYWHRTVVTSVAGAGNYCFPRQLIESVRTLAGKTATLSFWAKADASKNIAIEFEQIFGTGGSPSATVSGIGVTTCALTTSWAKFTVTVAIPSISGKTLGSSNNDHLSCNFWLNAGSNFNSRTNSLGQQSGTFDIAQVQLEEGSVATPFEMKPIGMEIALCQRYYQRIYDPPLRGAVPASDIAARVGTMLPVKMRAAPTLAVLGTLSFYDGAVTTTSSTLSAAYSTVDSIEFNISGLSGLTVGNPVVVYINTLSGSITASAEL